MSRRALAIGLLLAALGGAGLVGLLAAMRDHRAAPPGTGGAPRGAEGAQAALGDASELLDGATLVEELPEGDLRRYPLELQAGRYLLLEVDQREVDAVLFLYSPDGELLVESDGVNGAQGPEWLSLVSDRAGTWVLEVHAVERPGEVVGQIAVRVAEHGAADERNRRRVAADRTAAAGRRHYLEGSIESLAVAEVELAQAAAEFQGAGDAAGEADSLFVLGAARTEKERFQDTLEPLSRALELARSIADPRRQADILWLRGWSYVRLAEWRLALDDLTGALPLWQQLGDTAREVRTLVRLVDAYVQVGDRRRALEYATIALRTARSLGDSRELCDGYQSVATVRLWLGTPELALAPLEESLAISRRRGWRDAETASLVSYGVALRMLGRNEAARRSLEQALALRRDRSNPFAETEILNQLAGTYPLSEPRKRALLEQALALSREVGYATATGTSLTNLARLELEQGELVRARTMIEEAVEVREALWRRAPTTDLQATFLADQFSTYEVYVDVLAALDRAGADPGAAALALSVSDGARARALRQELQRASVEVSGGVPRELLDRRRALGRTLLVEERARTAGQSVAARIEALEAELRAVERDIAAASPAWAALMLPGAVTAEGIQRDLLDDDTVLLEYGLGFDRSHVFAVGASSLEMVELPPRAVIEAAARRVSAAITARNHGVRFETVDERAERVAAADAELTVASRALSRMILDPVRDHIAGKRLALVTDGLLQYVPFGALPEPGLDAPLALGHEIVHLPSASALREIRRQSKDRPAPPATLAVLADPVLRAEDPRLRRGLRWWRSLASLAGGRAHARPLATDEPESPWPELPFAREEADSILALVPATERFGALGFDASRATAASPELERYRIVHFATHTVLDDEAPARSGIVLSSFDPRGRPQEAVLSLFDIYQLHLPADLVVLSGCRTALGKEIRGEGLVGLTRGFMFAGARRVLVSLWDVQDRATAELMKRFYASLLIEQRSPAEALRRAQIEMARSEEWDAPYYWAGFVLQGDWR